MDLKPHDLEDRWDEAIAKTLVSTELLQYRSNMSEVILFFGGPKARQTGHQDDRGTCAWAEFLRSTNREQLFPALPR
jgi:hypothetical protein